jgi:ParB-like chromosome segregation protein Spo0J
MTRTLNPTPTGDPPVSTICARCKGTKIDPEHVATEQYGTGDVRELPTPCADCQLETPADADLRDRVEVWPLARVLAEVRCGSRDWSWDEEWLDLDARHVGTGYLGKLEQQIREKGITMPVLIGTDGRLWDGHHRLRIAVRLGIEYVPVELAAPAPEHRLALSEALSLGTGAPWDAIEERAAEVVAELAATVANLDTACEDGAAAEARSAPAGATAEARPETPLEKRLRYSERRNDELRGECLRRGKVKLEYAEKIQALEREIDGLQRQLGAEILRAGEAEADLRCLADEAQQAEAVSEVARLSAALERGRRLALTFEVSGNEFIAAQIRTALDADDAQHPAPADRGAAAAIDETAATIQAEEAGQ